MGATSTLDTSRAHVALIALYLNKAETRDKICRAIQYGSKFLSGGEPGTAQNVDKATSQARKVFRLLKSVHELQALLTPAAKNTPLPLVLLGRAKSALIATFLALDQVVWLGRSGIYKNKERADLISKVSLYCWLSGSACQTLIEAGELARLAAVQKKLDKEQAKTITEASPEEQLRLKEERLAIALKSSDRTLNLVKSALDIVVAVGLLQLAPKTVNARVTGALGFTTSMIACYQLLPQPVTKSKVA